MDYDVLVALASREAYERYSRFVKRSSLSKEAHTIFEAIGEWFKNNPAKAAVDWPGFAAWFTLVRHAKLNMDQQQQYKGLLDMLAKRQLSVELDSLMEGLTKRDYFARIGEAALRGADGDYSVSVDDLQHLIDKYKEDVGKLDALDRDLGDFSLERLSGALTGGLQWRLRALQQSLGPIRQGDLGVFAARPDSGKTTFLAFEEPHMAAQLPNDRCVLHINNEEQGDKVRRRIIQGAIGWTVQEMEEDFPAALAEYEAFIGHRDKIMVFDRAKVHTKDVETLCKRLNPGLVVFDQLRKVHGFEQEAEHERQTLLYNWARELAKEYAPVLNVTQAGAEGADRKWLGMEDIYGAKTGPQGEADFVITMGRVLANGNKRYISIPKNKLQTPGDPSQRNGRWEVAINGDTAQFEEPKTMSR